MVNQMRKESFDRAKKVKLIIMDVDGTLTDGGIYIGESGELFKSFNCRDGFGITLAKRVGIEMAIITGRVSKQLLIRAQELQINPEAILQGHLDKREAYIELKNKFNLADEEIAYIGDDILDLPIMVQVGFTGTVANAVTEVKNRVCVVSDFNGGQGAVREIIEFILKAKNLWNEIVAEYLDPEIKQPKELFYLAANKSNQPATPVAPSPAPVRRPTPLTQSAQPAQSIPQAQPARPQTPPPQRVTPPQKVVTPSPQPQQPARTPQLSHAEQMKQIDEVGKKFNFKF